MTSQVLVLLVLYQFKHFICDYPLQGKYMLGKFKPGYDWVKPLAAHSLVHAAWTFAIVLHFQSKLALPMALLDFVLHFTMDRIKASPNLLGRFKALDANNYVGVAEMAAGVMHVPLNKHDTELKVSWAKARLKHNTYFWWALGLDQMVHHLTHYLIIYLVVS